MKDHKIFSERIFIIKVFNWFEAILNIEMKLKDKSHLTYAWDPMYQYHVHIFYPIDWR